MQEGATNIKVEQFFENVKKWKPELEKLRTIVLNCMLTEDFKWMHPCYTFQNKNIVIIHGFKEYCALLFFKGSLLQDTHQLLIQQTENVQAGRQIRFTNLNEIIKLEPILKTYIYEAIEVEKAGLQIEYKKVSDYEVVEEFQQKLNENKAFQKAFEALTPGRQKAYCLHFAGAKQSKTRISRIEECIPKILAGKGFNDCVCGLSKKMPYCDGSHKSIPNFSKRNFS